MTTNVCIYTEEEILKAIPGTYGIMARIAKNVGCNRQTIKEYSLRFESIKQAIEQEKEISLDKAESIIYEDIEIMKNVDTAKWLLSKIGKDRGYVTEATKDLADVNITIEYVNDWRNRD